jgi:hypothetical protein
MMTASEGYHYLQSFGLYFAKFPGYCASKHHQFITSQDVFAAFVQRYAPTVMWKVVDIALPCKSSMNCILSSLLITWPWDDHWTGQAAFSRTALFAGSTEEVPT